MNHMILGDDGSDPRSPNWKGNTDDYYCERCGCWMSEDVELCEDCDNEVNGGNDDE